MKLKKRILSLLLCGALLFSICPQTASAAGFDERAPKVAE